MSVPLVDHRGNGAVCVQQDAVVAHAKRGHPSQSENPAVLVRHHFGGRETAGVEKPVVDSLIVRSHWSSPPYDAGDHLIEVCHHRGSRPDHDSRARERLTAPSLDELASVEVAQPCRVEAVMSDLLGAVLEIDLETGHGISERVSLEDDVTEVGDHHHLCVGCILHETAEVVAVPQRLEPLQTELEVAPAIERGALRGRTPTAVKSEVETTKPALTAGEPQSRGCAGRNSIVFVVDRSDMIRQLAELPECPSVVPRDDEVEPPLEAGRPQRSRERLEHLDREVREGSEDQGVGAVRRSGRIKWHASDHASCARKRHPRVRNDDRVPRSRSGRW